MSNRSASEIFRFHFCPVEDEDPTGVDIFVRMTLPQDCTAASVEDAISSYIDSTVSYSFEDIVLDVATSFDPSAEIVELTTFNI